MKHLFAILFPLISINAYCQDNNRYREVNPELVIKSGRFIAYHTYHFDIKNTPTTIVQYDNRIVEKQTDGTYMINLNRSGFLEVFEVSGKDTIIKSRTKINVIEPELRVRFMNEYVGKTIKRKYLETSQLHVTVDVPDNDMSETFPIKEVVFKYIKNGTLEEFKISYDYENENFPGSVYGNKDKTKALIEVLSSLAASPLILQVLIHTPTGDKYLPPAVYYLD